MKAIIAGIAGVFVAIFGVIGVLVFGGNDRTALTSEPPTPEVIAERQAPATRADPMTPVTTGEAARRGELHERIAGPASRTSAAVMAPPVVTEIRDGNASDPLAVELFGDIFTPEPVVEPEPEVVAVEPEVVEPEPELQVVEVEEPAAPALNPAQFRERFRVNTERPAADFGVRNFEPVFTGPRESGAWLGPDALRQILGDAAYVHMAGYRDDEDGWFEPFQVADGLGNLQGLFDPVVRPTFDIGRVQQGYGAPLPSERSAARPAMTNVDIYGNAYTTSNAPNPHLAAQNGPVVLARSGDILTARLLYGFNSDDVRGLPIYAVINDYLPNGSVGPLEGARIQGQVAYSQRNAAIIFESLVLPNGREFDITAIAVSLDSDGRPGVAADVNNHTVARYGSLFLSGIIQGIGEVAQIRLQNDPSDQPVVIINEGDGTVNVDGRNSEPTDGEILAGALAPVGRQLSAAAGQGFNRPPTITAPAGMPFGLVFTSTTVSEPGQARTAFNPRTGQLEVVNAPVVDQQPTTAIGGAGNVTIPQSGETFVPASQGTPEALFQSLGEQANQ